MKILIALILHGKKIYLKKLVSNMTEEIKAGNRVRCVAIDPRDEYYGFPDDKRWHIGDEFIVSKVEVAPYGTFLHDGKGHNMCITRAKLIK